MFWDFFYDGAAVTITPWLPVSLKGALDPVNGDVVWQTNERNVVNYDTFVAWSASKRFYQTFSGNKLASLSGPLLQQFETTEKLIKVALHFASDFGISNTALAGCGVTGTRLQIRKRLVKQQVPSLVNQSDLAALLDS